MYNLVFVSNLTNPRGADLGGDAMDSPPLTVQCSEPRSRPSRARCRVPLTFDEQVVLTLVHLDPRLTLKAERSALYQLVAELLPDRYRDQVGKALHRLRELHAAQMITTHAFDRPLANLQPPPLCEVERVFQELAKALGYDAWTTVRLSRLHDRVAELLKRPVAFHEHAGPTPTLLSHR